jgi:hypothetical protein
MFNEEVSSLGIEAIVRNYRGGHAQVQEVIRFLDNQPTGVGFLQLTTLDGLHTHFYTLRKEAAEMVMERQPVLHCIGELGQDSLENFVSIMSSSSEPSGFRTPASVENVSVHVNGIPDRAYYGLYADSSQKAETLGDRYALKLYENAGDSHVQSPILAPGGAVYPIAINVQETPVTSIKAVITVKNNSDLSRKIRFYEDLFGRENIPTESCSFLIIKTAEDGSTVTEELVSAQDLFSRSKI